MKHDIAARSKLARQGQQEGRAAPLAKQSTLDADQGAQRSFVKHVNPAAREQDDAATVKLLQDAQDRLSRAPNVTRKLVVGKTKRVPPPPRHLVEV